METEGHGRRRVGADHGGDHVPTMADYVEAGGMVSECGNDGTFGVVLRHGYIPTHTVLCDGVCGAARLVVVPQSV